MDRVARGTDPRVETGKEWQRARHRRVRVVRAKVKARAVVAVARIRVPKPQLLLQTTAILRMFQLKATSINREAMGL